MSKKPISMKLDEIQRLSDEELRIKVAELLDLTDVGYGHASRKECAITGDATDNAIVGTDYNGETVPVPNYPADLNACHEMEKSLCHPKHIRRYSAALHTTCECRYGSLYALIAATARQRCEAFVLTMQGE